MKLTDLKEVSNNVNIDEYLSLYKYVRDNIEHPEWLEIFTYNEIEEILNEEVDASDLEEVSSRLSELNYYNNTNK